MRLSDKEQESAENIQDLLGMQIRKAVQALCTTGIQGFPGGDHEGFCLWPAPDMLNLALEIRREDEWKYPHEIITSKEPGTLIWIPDSVLDAL